jgi:hypothetical protein
VEAGVYSRIKMDGKGEMCMMCRQNYDFPSHGKHSQPVVRVAGCVTQTHDVDNEIIDAHRVTTTFFEVCICKQQLMTDRKAGRQERGIIGWMHLSDCLLSQ